MNYDASFLLTCVYKYSANQSCVESARKFLKAIVTGDDKAFEKEMVYAGDFMKACAKGMFFEAFRRADQHNQLALELGMKDFFKAPWIWGELPKLKELEKGGIPGS